MNIAKTDSGQRLASWSARRMSILLTIIALILWSHSITQAKLNIGFYGLIHSFPVTFFIALGILTIASAILWISNENHQKLLSFQLLFLITVLWFTPTLIGSHPGFGCAYRNLGLVTSIAEQGEVFRTWYLAWPGAHVLFAIVSELGGVSLEPILGIFPFLMQLLWLLPLYVFLRNVFSEAQVNYCWAGLWLFSLANWIGQEYFSPQSIAFLLTLTLLALITSPSLWKEDSRALPFVLGGTLIVAGITVTHLLVALAVSCILAAFSLAKRAKKLAPLVVLCLLLIICWDITGGAHYTSKIQSEPLVETPTPGVETPTPGVETPTPGVETPTPSVETPRGILVFDPEYIVETNVMRSLAGSESHIAVVQTRILFSSIFAVLGIVAAILTLLVRRNRISVCILAMEMALLLLLPLAKQFGWELVHRLYLFSLPFMAYFGAMLLDMGRKLSAIILCLLLIASCPLFVICHYGNQAFDYFPQGQVAGLHFLRDKTSHGYITGASPAGSISMNTRQYQRIGFDQLDWQGNILTVSTPPKKPMPHYIGISRRDRTMYEFIWGDTRFIPDVEWSLDTSTNCNFVYNNPDLKLYVVED